MNSSMEKTEEFVSSEFQENLEILRQIEFFSGLPLESLKLFAYICDRETYKAGDYLFRQDDDDGQAFYIISGNVRVIHDDGGESHELRSFGPGSFLGGLVLLSNMHRLFSMQAVDDVVCMVVARDKFNTTLQQFPDILNRFIKAVVNSITSWEQHFLSRVDDKCVECWKNFGVSLL